MGKTVQLSIIAMLSLLVFSTGCASKSKTNRQMNALQAQVGVLTDELIRLDESLQSTRSAIQEEEGRRSSAMAQVQASDSRLGNLYEEESVIRGIYRTPSGFELPSISIQKALKAAGYYNGALDGKIGPETRKAIKAFQADNGLTADGVVGRQTWKKLQAYTSPIK